MFIDNLDNELNFSITENNAKGYASTKSKLLDFNFKVASYRNLSEQEIINDFIKVFYENKELALKFIFFARDIRQGLGERRLFRVCIKEIADLLDSRVFEWIEEFGRLDDLFVFFNTSLESKMIQYVKNKLIKDYEDRLENKPISLLAKWMPSINTSSTKTIELAKKFANKFGWSPKKYRKILSNLRHYLDVVEVKCSSNKWNEIDYAKVPSQANIKYLDAFLRHDENRRIQFLDDLKKGNNKINASTLFPHQIVAKYRCLNKFLGDEPKFVIDDTLEELWKALPNFSTENKNTIVVRDGSGSMTSCLGKTHITALDVSTALAIYFSERCQGQFKDTFITFSKSPKIVSLKKFTTLKDKLNRIYCEDDYTNTDIESVFNLILDTAVKNNLKQEDIPNILIISDMEFDECTSIDKKLFEEISSRFNQNGFKLPKLSFWNVNSTSNTIPIISNELGLSLISGFSPTLLQMVLTNINDPLETLLHILNSERYINITM